VHSVTQYGPYYWQFGPSLDHGIGPGESYTSTVGCNAGPSGSCAGVAEGYGSMVVDDLIPPNRAGFEGAASGVCFGSIPFIGFAQKDCGIPGMTGELFTVPPHP